MIHHEICEGRNLDVCKSCARNVSRFTEKALREHTTRIKPLANPPRCVDWLSIPRRSIDPSHSTL